MGLVVALLLPFTPAGPADAIPAGSSVTGAPPTHLLQTIDEELGGYRVVRIGDASFAFGGQANFVDAAARVIHVAERGLVVGSSDAGDILLSSLQGTQVTLVRSDTAPLTPQDHGFCRDAEGDLIEGRPWGLVEIQDAQIAASGKVYYRATVEGPSSLDCPSVIGAVDHSVVWRGTPDERLSEAFAVNGSGSVAFFTTRFNTLGQPVAVLRINGAEVGHVACGRSLKVAFRDHRMSRSGITVLRVW